MLYRVLGLLLFFLLSAPAILPSLESASEVDRESGSGNTSSALLGAGDGGLAPALDPNEMVERKGRLVSVETFGLLPVSSSPFANGLSWLSVIVGRLGTHRAKPAGCEVGGGGAVAAAMGCCAQSSVNPITPAATSILPSSLLYMQTPNEDDRE